MTVEDMIKAGRRLFEGNVSLRWRRRSRRALFLLLVMSALVLYVGPGLLRWLMRPPPPRLSVPLPNVHTSSDGAPQCIPERLYPFEAELGRLDSVVSRVPPQPGDHQHLPYVGNGFVALAARADSPLYLRDQRTLNVSVPFLAVVSARLEGAAAPPHEAVLLQYAGGVVQRLQCYPLAERSLDVTYKYLAHRISPGVLVQDIKVRNPTETDHMLELQQQGVFQWEGATVRHDRVVHGQDSHPYVVVTGVVRTQDLKFIGVVVVSSTVPGSVAVKASSLASVRIITSVNYTEPVASDQEARQGIGRLGLERAAVSAYTEAVSEDPSRLLSAHVEVWRRLWTSGFSISHSLADDVINGDVINATLYYVMSQARAPLHEKTTDVARLQEHAAYLQYTEGCFGDKLHSLQARRLWSPLQTVADVLETANLWLLLLEKKGCHNMLGAGADGVMQAMILSMGALKFSNQHLEFGMEPKDMHRDYVFRRVNFGNATHVTIRVAVDDNNKANLFVSLDRSDRSYFGCDAGCLDAPVKLGPEPTRFPVKLTDPPTAVLYITPDWQHLEELKHTIHVKEVSLAPAHDHHLMALHRHGHALGGLPTFFWVTIFLLIGVFHLFLIKLIINEYFGGDKTFRTRSYRRSGSQILGLSVKVR
ncbi:uncharacterized protein KIAA2013 homolog isoform X1 [Amphibalanus amphitrite]|uniref:uncharacterized protein KIAA2013 homolog isoform X1 n=1 Tax=Amphibalanus amphitrite TaxID=1232801 RepID=UPI001C925E85|nr:uncharacterized protein KIAA2013 homolog isoform X1 [Amphibalanus amphitrite]